MNDITFKLGSVNPCGISDAKQTLFKILKI